MAQLTLTGKVGISSEAFDAIQRVTVEFRRALRECSIELAKRKATSNPVITTEIVSEAVEEAFRRTVDSMKHLKSDSRNQDDRSQAA